MKIVRINKRFLITIVCTILVTLFCAPLYSNHLVSGLWQSLYANKTARIDIANNGDATNAVEITEADTSTENEITYPQWCQKENGQCGVINTEIAAKWQRYKVRFKVIGDGKITVLLRGPDVRDNNVRYPVLVDYRFASVNNKQFLQGRKTFYHDNPHTYHFAAKDGEIYELSFEVRKHHWQWGDLNHYSFSTLMFLSVLILAFLLSYKMVQYVAKFKLLEHNSRIDIVFVVAFIVLLFVPMSRISDAEKSMQENRMLATYPKFLVSGGVNCNYGAQFEKWFNDHFFGRESMIDLYSFMKRETSRIYRNGDAIWIKKSNWMFRNYSLKYWEKYHANDKEIIKQVNLLNDFCKKNNIRLYMLIVPSKEDIYREFAKEEEGNNNALEYDKFNHHIAELINLFEAPTVYPQKELKQAAQNDFVFFKQTHHWTDWGAYNGYLALMKVIKKDFTNIHISNLDEYNVSTSKLLREEWNRDFDIGGSTIALRINPEYAKKYILKDEYIYYDHKNEIQPTVTDIAYYKTKYFKNPQQPNAPRVFLTGTSMNEDFLQFIPYSFSELKYYRLNGARGVEEKDVFKLFKRYKKDILDFKPDILILCITPSNIPSLVNLTKD